MILFFFLPVLSKKRKEKKKIVLSLLFGETHLWLETSSEEYVGIGKPVGPWKHLASFMIRPR